MVYMISILQVSQEYEGLAWATYKAAYHRQAAATGHKQWSMQSQPITVHHLLCLSAVHKTSECSLATDKDPDLGQHLKAMESTVIAFSANPQGITATRGIRSSLVSRPHFSRPPEKSSLGTRLHPIIRVPALQ